MLKLGTSLVDPPGMTLTSLMAALASLAVSGPADPVPTAAAVDVAPSATAHVEYFLISQRLALGDDAEGPPIAVVALRTIDHTEDATDPEAASEHVDFLLEREVIFANGGFRVRHTESGRGTARRLVWREFLPKESRTWVAEWTAGERGASAHSIGYGWNRPVHERVMDREARDALLYGPLELLYGMRNGSLPCGEASGEARVIDPASASIVAAESTAMPSASSGTEVFSVAIDLRRPDGTLLIGADARPEGFIGFRLSDRPSVARRIAREEFDRLSRRWTVPSERPYRAVLALIPKRR